MSFQVVRASDNEIIVWHTEHGHIFVYEIPPRASELTARWVRDIPDATEQADTVKDAALHYATQEAKARRYLR